MIKNVSEKGKCKYEKDICPHAARKNKSLKKSSNFLQDISEIFYFCTFHTFRDIEAA